MSWRTSEPQPMDVVALVALTVGVFVFGRWWWSQPGVPGFYRALLLSIWINVVLYSAVRWTDPERGRFSLSRGGES